MKRLAALGIGVCVTMVGALAAFGTGLDTCRIPLVRSSEQAPVIDGTMQGSEWKYALAVKGLMSNEGSLAQRQATIYYLSDGQWLYIGAYAPAVPAGTAPEVKAGPKYEGKNYMDFYQNDRIEVKFCPPQREKVGDFIFVADAAGHTFLEVNKGFGEAVKGAFEYKTSYDEKGWTVEMRVPLSQFGQKAAADGDVWKLNFTLARLFPLKYEGLSSGGPHGTCEAILTADAPAVQIERLGDLPKGKLDLAVSVREYEGLVSTPKETAYDERPVESGGMTLATSGKVARVSWELIDADGKPVAADTRLLALHPGRTVAATFAKDFKPGPKNTLKLTVEVADSMKAFEGAGEAARITVLYAATLPFVPFSEEEAKAWQERLAKGTVLGSWRFNPAYLPYYEKAKVQTMFFRGRVRDQARKVRVTITSDKGFKAEREAPVVDGVMVAGTPDKLLEIPIPGLPAGVYKARGEVLDADGKVVSTAEREYVRKVFPWEHNTIGTSRGAIKPWTPMQVTGDSVACWGRTLELTPAGLAGQVVSQAKPLLAAPLAVDLRGADGQALTWAPAGKLAFAEKAADVVRWQGQAEAGKDIKVAVTGHAEYDGFTWYEITLTPSKPVAVASGRIVIAFPEKQAQLMHFQSTWARANFSGAIPTLRQGSGQGGDGVVFRSLDTSNYGWAGGFTPHVWIGNPTRGLSWFADSDEGWSSAADKSAQEIVRTNGQVQLVLNIIARPVTLDKPRTLRFGLMATPFKPLMPIKDIPTKAVNWLGQGGFKGGVIQAFMYAQYPLNFDYSLIDKNLPGCRLYFNKHEMGAALPERAVFDNEWGGMEPAGDYPGAPERFGPGLESRTISRALTDSRIDMMVYYIAELAKKSKMAATYWDITGIGASNELLENGAHVDPETGEVHPIRDLLKSRQLFKRVATLWQEIRGEPDYMEIHSTNHMGIPFYSFGYSWLNFEWLWPNANAKRPDGQWQDFIDLRPLDLFATEGSPSQFGVWINSINGGGRPDDPAQFRRVNRSAQAMGSLHNHHTGHTPTIGPRDQLEFVGYWDENSRVATDHELARASYWHKDNKLELVTVNLALEPRTVTVSIPLASLNWKGAGTVTEIDTGDAGLKDRPRHLRAVKKPELAESFDAYLKALSAAGAGKAPTLRVAGGKLQLTFELSSHDYRVFTVEGQ